MGVKGVYRKIEIFDDIDVKTAQNYLKDSKNFKINVKIIFFGPGGE